MKTVFRVSLKKLIVDWRFSLKKRMGLNKRLVRSIREGGQQDPVTVCRRGNRFVLLSGFARVEALRHLRSRFAWASYMPGRWSDQRIHLRTMLESR